MVSIERGWSKVHLQECRCTALYRASDPQLAEIRAQQGLQSLYRTAQEDLWSSQPGL